MNELINKCKILVNHSVVQMLFLILITLVLTTKDITVGDFPFSDSSAHAMNGVFIHDLIKKMPSINIYDFAVQYYGRYPKITIPFHPPVLPFFEAIFFFLFGISPVTAKLSVVFFSLLSVTFWYKLIKSLYNKKIAFFSGLLLITTPTVVLWSRQVMLEMPALAMIILSMYFLHTSVDLEKKTHLYYCAFCIGLALLTKQTAAFILPLALSYMIGKRKLFLLLTKEGVISCFIALIFLVPLAFLTKKFANYAIELVVMDTSYQGFAKSSLRNLFHAFKILPDLITVPLLILSCTSIALTILKRGTKKTELFYLWLFWMYALITYLSVKDVRYAYFWIPPFCLFGSLIYDKVKFKNINVALIFLCAVGTYQFVFAYQLDTPIVDGYEKAAKFVTDNPKGDTVLVSAHYNGNFIFHVRRFNDNGNLIVLRADKILPDARGVKNGYKETDIYNMLEDYGINYIVVEDKDRKEYPKMKLLRAILNSGNFTLRKRISLTSNIDVYKRANILIYEYNKDVSLKKKILEIDISKMGRKICIPMKTLSDASLVNR